MIYCFFSKMRATATLALSLSLCATLAPAWARPNIPENLGVGLRALIIHHYSPTDPEAAQPERAQYNSSGHVLVEIYANGKWPLAQLVSGLERLGIKIVAVNSRYRSGAISAYLPLEKATLAAQLRGLGSIALSHKPMTNVGKTTSQGALVHKTDLVNAAGFTGTGITVGVISDSYNVSPSPYTTASDDVASGDLPNLTDASNPNNPGVKFLIEATSGTDEGRGMAQIVHDLAPGADLCFATATGGQAAFANNIRTLRTNSACLADIVVDDIIYTEEPMFSDGQIAQAVDEVVSSTTLAGKPVAYFSSAGNRELAYNATFSLVSNREARTMIDPADPTINLRTVPRRLTGGGFHNFAPAGSPVDISQKVVSVGAAGTLVFQWNDPFDLTPSGITADYNILVFNSNGRFLFRRSGRDNNFATNQPIEIPAVTLQADTTYYIAISKTSQTTTTPVAATQLRYVLFDGDLQADYLNTGRNTQSTYGHNSAAGANGVAAYVYDSIPDNALLGSGFTPAYEGFSSQGPVTIYFDANGVRLTAPEQRKKPDFAAVDGVNTTSFPGPDIGSLSSTDYEGDGFPNFFGTSAAAPHAAGIAALLLQKAGGPSTLSYQDIRTILQTTAPARDADPAFSQAVTNTLTVSGSGGSDTSSIDPNFFHINVGGAGATLTALTIDLTGTNLNFDPTSTGFPLIIGSASPGVTITSPAPTARTSVLDLTFSGLSSGLFLNFGIDRDVNGINIYGNSADSLAGATITATFSSGSSVTATFTNVLKTGYTVYDGFGLIDAQAATNLLSLP
jgi:Subtilase family